MKRLNFLFALIPLTFLRVVAGMIISSSVYDWEKLEVKKIKEGEVRTILSGPTQTLDRFDIKAITLSSGKILGEYSIPTGCEEMIIIKEGSAEIRVNSETKILGEGSVVVSSQGDKVKISNRDKKSTTFYSFLFKAKLTSGLNNLSNALSPIMKDWNNIELKPNANGGRRDILKQPTSTLKELEMHTTVLNEGLPSHAAHNHPDEEIILVRFGVVEETINGKPYKLGPGSVIFLSNKDTHGISNAGKGKCEYYAIRWLTLTENK
jgi:quercetin dioxygenase-like cupin family protein